MGTGPIQLRIVTPPQLHSGRMLAGRAMIGRTRGRSAGALNSSRTGPSDGLLG